MSSKTSVPSRRRYARGTGEAIVVLRSGRRYVGTVTIDGQTVELDGHRVHRFDSGDGLRAHAYRVHKLWPLAQVRHIDFLAESRVAA